MGFGKIEFQFMNFVFFYVDTLKWKFYLFS
jgi:hypothetical protein